MVTKLAHGLPSPTFAVDPVVVDELMYGAGVSGYAPIARWGAALAMCIRGAVSLLTPFRLSARLSRARLRRDRTGRAGSVENRYPALRPAS